MAEGGGTLMDRTKLLEHLWVETAALSALQRPKDHDGRTACGCSWCRVSGCLRVLDDQYGMDLARAANEKLMARRAAMEPAKVAG